MLKVIELFAGIGAQRKALQKAEIEHEVIAISEIDKYAIQSYNAIHGETPNLGDITKIEKMPKADLWTYSFPCTDISLAGRMNGFEKHSGTHSSLLWEVQRLLSISIDDETLPKYLLMENVKNLISKKFKPEFSFKKNEAIFGQIYFEKTHTQIYNKETDTMVDITIPANTIVYDSSCHSVYSFGSEAITIAHECVHYELHKKAYLFAKFINNGNISCISCMNGGKVDGIAETDVNESFMEAQANGIAPFLIMPEESFKKRAEELYKEYSNSTQDPIEFIDRMISNLRNEYRVTIPAVKKRLRELGYLRNVSVFEWDKTNKKYIDAYAYQAGSLANDETFSITFDDYQKALDMH